VTGTAVFNDMKLIKDTLKNFNNVGLALAYVTNINKINEASIQLEKQNQLPRIVIKKLS